MTDWLERSLCNVAGLTRDDVIDAHGASSTGTYVITFIIEGSEEPTEMTILASRGPKDTHHYNGFMFVGRIKGELRALYAVIKCGKEDVWSSIGPRLPELDAA